MPPEIEEDGDERDPQDRDTGDDRDDDEPDDEGDEWTPPSREEWERTQESLAKANGEAKKYRLRLREAAKPKAGESDDAVEKRVAEERAVWKPRVIKADARRALTEAGAAKPERLLKLLDFDDLDVDDDGSVSGLSDEVERLQDEYPELFKTKRSGGSVSKGQRGDGEPAPKSASERQAAQLLRR